MKYKNWLNEWLMLMKPQVKERTLKGYEVAVRRHITNDLGEFELNKLTGKVLKDYALKLCESKLAPNTIKRILLVVKQSLHQAVEYKKVKSQNAKDLICPKIVEKPVNCFSRIEQKKIESYILTHNKPKFYGILITLYTGLRIGELLALTWQDIDFNKCTMTISKSCYDSWQNGKYKKIIDTPKTINSIRVIPLPKNLLAILKNLKRQSTFPYVVASKTNEGMQLRCYERIYSNLLKSLGIEHKGFHSLRHTFATRAIECGIDIKTVSELLGHKDPIITLRRYTHSQFEHKVLMMNKLGNLLKIE